MNRRSFLKTLCAAVGVSLVPNIGIALPGVPDPKWVIEEFDFGSQLGVGAIWGSGHNQIRQAVSISLPVEGIGREESIEYCKQALRQWYREHLNVVRIRLPKHSKS